jgi:hypothetical protein
MDPANFDMLVYTVAVDPQTGEVGLFCYYGGFGTWSEADGLRIWRRADVKAWDGVITYSGAFRSAGDWYSIKADAKSGQVSIARFNFTDSTWVDRVVWDEQWSPNVLTIDSESGDFYVSANGGWYYAVWRIVADGSYVGDLYMTDGTVPYRGFWGITSNY